MTGRCPIAIVGMAGRFPGAPSPSHLWPVIRDGIETIHTISATEHPLGGLIERPGYVPAAGVLGGVDQFDADFFGISHAEARLMDPQHRALLECCWHALEDAGCVPDRFTGSIGVFAGVGPSTYHQLANGHPSTTSGAPSSLNDLEDVAGLIASDRDFAATRVAHKLNLRGPAVTVQTACSTSLVAVHLAARSLLTGDCDAALAGGVAIRLPDPIGYLYRPGGILSPDGHCRPFSADAQGTVPGSGSGVVLLKRIDDATAAGDFIHAVIIGTAINNDGAVKLSYAAPSAEGQTAALIAAITDAGIDPATIGYLEAHGTGTPLGDPIEVAAATAAFAANGPVSPGACALGSLKANIGHLDTASGIAGLIKTALVLRHGVLPPAVHAHPVNLDLDLATSPFRLPTRAEPWPPAQTPRRAAVSSFGIGGTNAHVILQQAPEPPPVPPPRPHHLLLLSARTPAALGRRATDLASAIHDVPLAALSSTLLTGRAELPRRRAHVVTTTDEAHSHFRAPLPATPAVGDTPTITFLLPGFGAQRPGLTTDIYRHEAVFRETVDECANHLLPVLGVDLRPLLHPAPSDLAHATRALADATLGMPALFTIEYALTALLASWGIRPSALLGHSLGEWTAACIAGIVPLNQGLHTAAARGRLVDTLPTGTMLAVSLAARELRELLTPAMGIATDVGPDRAIVSGSTDDLAALVVTLTDRNIPYRPLPVDRALHSPAMDAISAPYLALLAELPLTAPSVPSLSNVSGTWITADEATNPDYWTGQLRATCEITTCLDNLAAAPAQVLLQVGPGRTLSTWARQHPAIDSGRHCLPTLTGQDPHHSPYRHLLASVGRLWEVGVPVDLAALDNHRQPRVPIPVYPFEPTRHWITDTSIPTGIGQPDGAPDQASLPADPLARLWATALGVDHIRDDDNFFDLGGDSLLALRLATTIRHELGHPTTPRDLMESPTLGMFRDRLSAREDDAGPPRALAIIPTPGGPRPTPLPPLYLVHPIGGGTLVYRELAAALADVCPVLGFTARGFDREHGRPRDDIDKIALAYVDEFLATRPTGPFWLAGSSFGGVIAHAMARILHNQGRPPALLALLDSPWPTATIPLPALPDGADTATHALYRAHHHALTTVTVDKRPLPLPAVYVRAADETHSRHDSWRAALGAAEVRESPGNHETMLRQPHVHQLAKLLHWQVRSTLMRSAPDWTEPS